MEIKWKNNTLSPVLFFVDDLANKWIDLNGDGKVQPEEDWGYAGCDGNGAFAFLEKEILSINPDIKVTFFVPVGSRAPVVREVNYYSYSYPINHSAKSISFFRSLAANPRFELAYHGTTHGVPGATASDFTEEWLQFASLDSALKVIGEGKDIYKSVFGKYPLGGKYCGYSSNGISDRSIDSSGFLWWCRYYNRGAIEGCQNDLVFGADRNPITAFNVKFFGRNKVVDIPTTLSGKLLNQGRSKNYLVKKARDLCRPLFIKWMLGKIDFLIKHRLVISIQEHMSPSREDGRRQEPNIIDDKESLRIIFQYLRNKNVWYCTGTEFAEWSIENLKKEIDQF